jgi:hypothetical protein
MFASFALTLILALVLVARAIVAPRRVIRSTVPAGPRATDLFREMMAHVPSKGEARHLSSSSSRERGGSRPAVPLTVDCPGQSGIRLSREHRKFGKLGFSIPNRHDLEPGAKSVMVVC